MPGRVERQDEVDRGQAGPDQQYGALFRRKPAHRPACLLTPRIVTIKVAQRREVPVRLRRLVSRRQHQARGVHDSAIRQGHGPAAVIGTGADGGRDHHLNQAGSNGVAKDPAQISAIGATLGKRPAIAALNILPEPVGRVRPGLILVWRTTRAYDVATRNA